MLCAFAELITCCRFIEMRFDNASPLYTCVYICVYVCTSLSARVHNDVTLSCSLDWGSYICCVCICVQCVRILALAVCKGLVCMCMRVCVCVCVCVCNGVIQVFVCYLTRLWNLRCLGSESCEGGGVTPEVTLLAPPPIALSSNMPSSLTSSRVERTLISWTIWCKCPLHALLLYVHMWTSSQEFNMTAYMVGRLVGAWGGGTHTLPYRQTLPLCS